MERSPIPPGPIVVQALYTGLRPELDEERLLAELTARLGPVEPVGDVEDGAVMVSVPGLPQAEIEGTRVPCSISFVPGPPDADAIERSLAQTWTWPDAAAVVRSVSDGWLAAPMLSWAWLDRATRVRLLHAGVEALVAVTDPVALHWPGSERLVDAAVYGAARGSTADDLYPVVNVRSFRILGAEDEKTLMDTVGLAALGLPDLQLLFAGPRPSEVAAQLADIALYVYEEGDVLADGHTVEGVPAGTVWSCRREDAAIGPKRVVVALSEG